MKIRRAAYWFFEELMLLLWQGLLCVWLFLQWAWRQIRDIDGGGRR